MIILCHFCKEPILLDEYERLVLEDECCPHCGQRFGVV